MDDVIYEFKALVIWSSILIGNWPTADLPAVIWSVGTRKEELLLENKDSF